MSAAATTNDGPSDAPSADAAFLAACQTEAELAARQGDVTQPLLAELDGLRGRCSCLQAENLQLASLVYEKDKATRLLLANVEAWKQKLDLAEKRKIDEVQRLQAGIAEKGRTLEYLAQGVSSMRAQLEERRAAESATQAGVLRLQELERENTALLDILHGKCKDNPPVLQLLASLQTLKQDLRLHETENARLLCLLGQRDKQCAYLAARCEETRSRIDRFAWDSGEAAAVRELVIERDRLRAQLAAVCVGRDHPLPPPAVPETAPAPRFDTVPGSRDSATTKEAAEGNQENRFDCDKDYRNASPIAAGNKDYRTASPMAAGNKDYMMNASPMATSNKDYMTNGSPMLIKNKDYLQPEVSDMAEEKENSAIGGLFAAAPQPQVLPIGSGRSVKRKPLAAAKPKTPVKSVRSVENTDENGLAADFNRLSVASSRAPLGQLIQ